MESNRMIAEFEGYRNVQMDNDGAYYINKQKGMPPIRIYPQYHTSWDWLMPVVEKIEILGYRVDIHENVVDVFKRANWDDTIAYCKKESKLESTYSAVVQFIQYYNQQSKQAHP